jgi:ribosomal protein L19
MIEIMQLGFDQQPSTILSATNKRKISTDKAVKKIPSKPADTSHYVRNQIETLQETKTKLKEAMPHLVMEPTVQLYLPTVPQYKIRSSDDFQHLRCYYLRTLDAFIIWWLPTFASGTPCRRYS